MSWLSKGNGALVALCVIAAVLGYVLWVLFSYLLVPFAPPSYEIRLPVWQHDGYYNLRPGVYENPLHGVFYTINDHGFRGADFALEKDRYRVICIGESSTAGIESPDDETWPARLQTYLGPDVEVINAGVGGSTSAEHRQILRSLLIYDPDLVLG